MRIEKEKREYWRSQWRRQEFVGGTPGHLRDVTRPPGRGPRGDSPRIGKEILNQLKVFESEGNSKEFQHISRPKINFIRKNSKTEDILLKFLIFRTSI